jgi:sec-independent protein translocase protein TatA
MGLDNPLHIAFLVVILLLVFGAKRLPELGRSLGSGMREFKQSITGESPAQQQPALTASPQQPAIPSVNQPVASPPAPVAAQPAPVAAQPAPVAAQPAPVDAPEPDQGAASQPAEQRQG